MSPDELVTIQAMLGLSDRKMAAALGITRQTVANWKRGKPFPAIAATAIQWMMTLRRLDPANDNLPRQVRVKL